MNNAQLDAQRRQVAAEAAGFDKEIAQAVATKSYGMLADLEDRVNKLAEDRADMEGRPQPNTWSTDCVLTTSLADPL